MTTERITELTATGGKLRVDRTTGVIHNAKILGLHSANGREYQREAVEKAVPLYEGRPCYIDHKEGARSYADRIGTVRGVVSDGAGLRGRLCINLGHPLAQAVLFDAENTSEGVGLSHTIDAKLSRRNGTVVVESITRVHSVDLVASPATTRTLGESSTGQAGGDGEGVPGELRETVLRIADEVRLPRDCVTAILHPTCYIIKHCKDEAAIREHLAHLRKIVCPQAPKLAAADRAAGDPDFLATVGANRPGGRDRFNETVLSIPTEANRHAIDEALGLPNRNSKAKSFLDAIS